MGGCGRAYVSGVGWIGEMGRGGEGGGVGRGGGGEGGLVGGRGPCRGIERPALGPTTTTTTNSRPASSPSSLLPPFIRLYKYKRSARSTLHCHSFLCLFSVVFCSECLFVCFTAAQAAWGERSRSAQPISELLLANKHPL